MSAVASRRASSTPAGLAQSSRAASTSDSTTARAREIAGVVAAHAVRDREDGRTSRSTSPRSRSGACRCPRPPPRRCAGGRPSAPGCRRDPLSAPSPVTGCPPRRRADCRRRDRSPSRGRHHHRLALPQRARRPVRHDHDGPVRGAQVGHDDRAADLADPRMRARNLAGRRRHLDQSRRHGSGMRGATGWRPTVERGVQRATTLRPPGCGRRSASGAIRIHSMMLRLLRPFPSAAAGFRGNRGPLRCGFACRAGAR